MKNFDKKEKQIKEICDTIRTADNLDLQLQVAFYDISALVRKAYYEGWDDGVNTLAEIQLKNQEKINDLFKQYNK
jgi:hypothetical protein